MGIIAPMARGKSETGALRDMPSSSSPRKCDEQQCADTAEIQLQIINTRITRQLSSLFSQIAVARLAFTRSESRWRKPGTWASSDSRPILFSFFIRAEGLTVRAAGFLSSLVRTRITVRVTVKRRCVTDSDRMKRGSRQASIRAPSDRKCLK